MNIVFDRPSRMLGRRRLPIRAEGTDLEARRLCLDEIAIAPVGHVVAARSRVPR